MEKNGTVMDYLRWRGDLPFTRDGFNEVDDLVLCIISYINFRRFDDLKTTDPARAVALPEVAARLTEEDEQLGLSELDYIPLMRLAAETERFRAFSYDELIKRDKASLDIFWLKDESLEDSENLPAPEVLARDIVENLQAALEQFAGIYEELGPEG